ncbi:MAG TPA: winged helix-turn-helix domain-containing protein [Planctomycetaceae bacterium]|nr:winged helix-turn-helix domain-containing protein [Planctomycetaceae bacterium]
MSTEQLPHNVDSIGTVAGMVWSYLTDNGAVTLSKLAREIDAPRDLVMQGVGWLAREDKVVFNEGKRSKTVSLK